MYLDLIKPYIGAYSATLPQKVEAGAIRRFAIASMETDPVYYDEEYAKTTSYGTIIAPSTFTRSLFFPPVLPVEGEILPIRGRVHAKQEFHFFKPIKAGDTVYCRSKICSAHEKQGSSGYLLFIKFEHAALDENGEPYNLGYNTSVYKEAMLKSTDPDRFRTWFPTIPNDQWLSGLSPASADNISVGTQIGPIDFPEITRTWIAQWAGATGDFNPIHLDDERAKATGMNGCIAHGMLSSSVVTRIFDAWLGKPGCTLRTETKFASPVYIGDHLSLFATISKSEKKETFTEITWEFSVKNQHNANVLSGIMLGKTNS